MSTPNKSTPPTATPESRWRDLRARIEPHAKLLTKQGSLASRLSAGRRVWSLRFVERLEDGKSVQRAIYIGADEALVAQVRALLVEYRRMAIWAQESAEFARFCGRLAAFAKNLRLGGT